MTHIRSPFLKTGYLTTIRLATMLTVLLLPTNGHAADIDIYSGSTSATGAPSLLITMDNAANFTSNYGGATPCGYTDSATVPGLNGKNGSMEQCAINNVIDSLPVNADGTARVSVGLMVYNATGITPASGTGLTCNNSGKGGCLIYPIKPMTAANKTALKAFVKSWTAQNIGANAQHTSALMQEAWAYLSGNTGPSGTAYTSPISQTGCQRTHVVFVANAIDTNGTPGEGGGTTPGADLYNVVTTRVDPTTGQVALQTSPINQQAIFAPATIQITSGNYGISGVYNCSPAPYVMPTHSESSGLYADEWARYMYGTDLFTGAMPASRSVTTYAIGVLSNSCRSDYPALLSSIAKNGKGKYYAVQTSDELASALNSILNEVQAVNSVFSSATLPVSVNTQGTYLNQIYMGMFRPDANANPRWIGNVKQYQFQLDANANLFLADATGRPAISATTGFITPDATSFWTCTNPTRSATLAGSPSAPYKDFSTLPTCAKDPANGYWINDFNYANFSFGRAFDMQDGEVVEKGGASQQIRLENLNDDYTTNAGTATNPRRLYSLCPGSTAGCTCTSATSATTTLQGNSVCATLADPVNAFSANNAAIPTTLFGSGTLINVTSITRSGNTATVTTALPHGWASGNSVTISGASPKEYSGTFSISVTGTNTFTFTVPEYPPVTSATSPTGILYQMQAGQASLAVTGITRTFTSGSNPSPNPDQETATVTTAVAHNLTAGNQVVVSGGNTNENAYNGQKTVATVPTSTTFTYPVTITPPSTATNVYKVALHSATPISITSHSVSGNKTTVTTATAHGFHTGDFLQIASTTPACFAVAGAYVTVTGTYTFTYITTGSTGNTCTGNTNSGSGGTATPIAGQQTIATLTRTGTTNTATASATINNSQFASGDIVDIIYVSGTATNESRYTGTYAITCLNTNPGNCTSFTYSVSTGPVYPGTSTFTVSVAAASANVIGLTRGSVGSTTATATLDVPLPGFTSPGTINVFAKSGVTPPASEAGYQGTFTATCGATCATIIYSTIPLTPVTPATGTITAYNPLAPPPKNLMINWVRGEDNVGDESSMCPPGTAAGTANCPSPKVTIRPSVHGDALHSRPIAVNYGGSTGVVVYYGTNDGVYHAINGNQTASITNGSVSVAPGGELWGFVAPDFFPKLTRQRNNLPQLLLPDTPAGINPTPQPKDYFIDGPTGLLQRLDANGNTYQAIIYIGGRRGGHVLYAVDVTNPLNPIVLWKIDNATPNMGELGEVWSLPKVARVKGYTWTNPTTGKVEPKPVIIIGGGYDDGSEDNEPPVSATSNGGSTDMGSDNIGRAIFVLDALDGHTIWQANHYNLTATPWSDYWTRAQNGALGGVQSTATGTTINGASYTTYSLDVYGFNYSVPADVTLVDRDSDGLIDRLYATDTGGNVWRVDLEPNTGSTPDKWMITQLAALGCDWGPCDTQLNGYPSSANPATTQRKMFFPAEVVTAIGTQNFDAVYVGTGDREHPLATQQANSVANHMYMLKDFNTGKDSSSQVYPITLTGKWGVSTRLDDCTGGTCTTATTGASTALPYCQLSDTQQHSGYYFSLNAGEKAVNAPMAAAGYVYFGTNQPATASQANTCTTNLGIARGYQLSTDLCAKYDSVIYTGGGLPPSPVSGIVDIVTANGTVAVPFCVGCPSPLTDKNNNCSSSALGACKPSITVPPIRRRNYWSVNNK